MRQDVAELVLGLLVVKLPETRATTVEVDGLVEELY